MAEDNIYKHNRAYYQRLNAEADKARRESKYTKSTPKINSIGFGISQKELEEIAKSARNEQTIQNKEDLVDCLVSESLVESQEDDLPDNIEVPESWSGLLGQSDRIVKFWSGLLDQPDRIVKLVESQSQEFELPEDPIAKHSIYCGVIGGLLEQYRSAQQKQDLDRASTLSAQITQLYFDFASNLEQVKYDFNSDKDRIFGQLVKYGIFLP